MLESPQYFPDLCEIVSDFAMVDSAAADFGIDFDLFALHFPEFHFYEFLVEKKKIRALHAQIEMVLFKLIDRKYRLFGFAFCLTIQKIDYGVLPQEVLLFLEGKDLVDIELGEQATRDFESEEDLQ